MSNAKPPSKDYRLAQRLTALGYGIPCHLLFAAGIVAMAIALFHGMRIGHGPFRGWPATVANVLLLMSFPLSHSWLLSPAGRRFMARLVPFGIGKELSTTVFATISAAQLLAVFLLWSPSGIVWWEAAGGIKLIIAFLALGAWILLGKSMADAQLSLQTGFIGWSAVFRNRAPTYKPFATKGVYRHVRQPIYVSFALVLWLSSAWTPDQLLLAVLWTSYCVAGSALKEKRYLKHFGDAFRQYQDKVPFWIPFLRPSRRDGTTPAPQGARARDVDVVIAGGGPVGLLLANLLGRRGLSVLVAERRTGPPRHSMAIGITPPSLSILKRLDLDDEFTRRGVSIDTARVFENRRRLGDVDFSRLPAEHRFILSLPQSTTVEVLQDNLRKYPNIKLVHRVELVGQQQTDDAVRVVLREINGGPQTEVSAAYLVGCDGHRSAVRRIANIHSRSRRYRTRFLMADFDDDTALGKKADLYFGPLGSVESFPLPDGRRRWIVLAGNLPADTSRIAGEVSRCVRERAGFDLSGSKVHFQSSFQPGRALARAYAEGRVALCGDAAHVMSPIGGQGMNTGFADAEHLDRVLAAVLEDGARASEQFKGYNESRRRAFRVAADRAARGMWMGTRTGPVFSALRSMFIARVLLRPPIRESLAPYFAMLTIPDSPYAAPKRAAAGGIAR